MLRKKEKVIPSSIKYNKMNSKNLIAEISQNCGKLTKTNLISYLKIFLKISIKFEHPELTQWIKKELNGYNIGINYPKYRRVEVWKFPNSMYDISNAKIIIHFFPDRIDKILKWVRNEEMNLIDANNIHFSINKNNLEKIIEAIILVLFEYCIFLESNRDLIDYYQFILRNNLFPEEISKEILSKMKKNTTKKIFKFENLPNAFYKKLIRDMDLCYKYRMFSTLRILERKLLENLLIEILRIKFKQDIEVYFNLGKGRFKDLSDLIQVFKEKIADLKPFLSKISKEYIENNINPFRKKGNASAHLVENIELKADFDEDLEKYINVIIDLLILFNNLKITSA